MSISADEPFPAERPDMSMNVSAAVYRGAKVPSSPESAGLLDRGVNSVERRCRTKSVLTHYKAGIPHFLWPKK